MESCEPGVTQHPAWGRPTRRESLHFRDHVDLCSSGKFQMVDLVWVTKKKSSGCLFCCIRHSRGWSHPKLESTRIALNLPGHRREKRV